MKTVYKMILFLSILILISCDKKDELSFFDSEDLYGYWINPVSNDSIINITVEYWGGSADY